jgi:dTDP-4-amino-4,6-dideoxygalactose transaminase
VTPFEPITIFDTRPQHTALSDALHAAFERVVTSGAFILGDEVAGFERRCANLLGAAHAVAVSNGSDALFLALKALGIGPGDEVITTAFTFIATAEAILRTGATPVFADIDPIHLGLCPASTQRMLSAKTRAVLYVHLYGNLGSISEHARLCREHGLWLVEDACQAFGARLDERYAGVWGDIGCYSFFPTKPLGGLGDGGLCVTDDPNLLDRLQTLRAHGVKRGGQCETLSGNFRLDALQAALLSEKIALVEPWRLARANIAARYTESLRDCRHLQTPIDPSAVAAPAWALYTLRVANDRKGLRIHLEKHGIESRSYYSSVLADHAAIASCCRRDALTQAVRASHEVLSVPIYFGLTAEAQQRIIERVLAWDSTL